jgi:hypothetical protein
MFERILRELPDILFRFGADTFARGPDQERYVVDKPVSPRARWYEGVNRWRGLYRKV